ncbi:MAG: MBL fold metallo-hydrolase [Ruminococcaceae bacterium]|nr:MBL fold metallo-hydrolase [Oscillospiraceae bacterium]
MAKFFPMFSSSSGNATYIGGANGGVLVDVGVSFKRIKDCLSASGIPLESIKAVLVTHEHNDHIKGLKVLLKNLSVPVVASSDTVYALEFLKVIDENTKRVYIDKEETFRAEDLVVTRFATSHDCKGSSGFVVEVGDIKTAVCTDLGIMTDEVKNALKGSNLVMLESNHDPVMLRLGPYPAELKIRIASDKGHLPNAVCAQTVAELYATGTTRFVLGHLSESNNTPEKASSAARAALMDKGAIENSDYILYVAAKEGNRIIPL